jgi:hypothetical protein
VEDRSDKLSGKDGVKMALIDSNVLIGLLVMVSVLAYIFVLRRIKAKEPDITRAAAGTDGDILNEEKETAEPQQIDERPRNRLLTRCNHHFGYLSSLSKKSAFPKECHECSKMTKCMSRKKPRKTRDRQTDLIVAADEETEFPEQL